MWVWTTRVAFVTHQLVVFKWPIFQSLLQIRLQRMPPAEKLCGLLHCALSLAMQCIVISPVCDGRSACVCGSVTTII